MEDRGEASRDAIVTVVDGNLVCVYGQVTNGKKLVIAATIGWRESRRLPSQGEGLAMEDHVMALRAPVGFLFLFRSDFSSSSLLPTQHANC
jgi:hypothetical protein